MRALIALTIVGAIAFPPPATARRESRTTIGPIAESMGEYWAAPEGATAVLRMKSAVLFGPWWPRPPDAPFAIVAGAGRLPPPTANRAKANYQFQLVSQTIKVGQNLVTIRFVDQRSGKPVPDAVIFATRLDLSPEGRQDIATRVTTVAGGARGTSLFRANLSTAGNWALWLGAKIQGGTGSVEGKVILKATP